MLLSRRLLLIPLSFSVSFLSAPGAYALPTANNDTVTATPNTPMLIDVLANDTPLVDLNPKTVNIKRPFRRGIYARRDGKVRFTPITGSTDPESFNYTVRDNMGGLSNIATVTVTFNFDDAPVVSAVELLNTVTDAETQSDIVVTFSEPVTVSGNWFQIDCTGSGAHTATVSGSATTYILNPDVDFAGAEACTVTITATQVADQDGVAPLNMATDFSTGFNTAKTLVGTSARVQGNIFPNADVDRYAFTAAAGDRVYAAVMTNFSANGSVDSQLRIFQPDGATVLEFDDNDGSLGSSSSTIAGATIPSNGTYYLEVKHFSATGQLRPYELYFRLQSGAPTAETETNDTPATANPLPVNGWVSGTRNPAAAPEQDWYSFTANAGDTIYLGLDLDPERDNVQWDGRLGIAQFGNAGDQILSVDDGNAGSVANPLSEAHFLTIKTAGTYYAVVDSANAATGDPTATYNLSVSTFPATDEGANCTTYTSTDVPRTIPTNPGMVSSTISVPGNPRIADIDVNIELNHNFMNDLDVHLRSPAGNDNGLFADIGSTTAGVQTQMDVTFDDEAGSSPFAVPMKSLRLKPELNDRLSWFDGEDAGGTWTLDLRDDTSGNGGTLTGWSLRICEPPPPPTACPSGYTQQIVFSTDFEANDGGFTHSGTQDEWEYGLPSFAPLTTCNSGNNCWKTDLDNTYNLNSNQDLLSPSIDLSGVKAPVIVTWAQRYQMENADFDHYSIDIQQVGGSTPSRLFEWHDATMRNTVGNPAVTLLESAGWATVTARADAYAGFNTELRFHLDSDPSVNLAGVAIDDVSVKACVPNP